VRNEVTERWSKYSYYLFYTEIIEIHHE